MLLGQNFGGRHHRHLRTGFDGGERGERGHDGFAAAHIALQQAVHGKGLRHIGADFGQHARLCAGERKGQQAYWVCPLIEESETLQLQTATETQAALQAALPELSIGLVHGRMKAAEKAEVMAEFSAGRLNVLVATTVIEVGVDVPNAALMVIEHAERMGLAQLHQLRGRVGRGAAASACVLLFAEPLGDIAKARLKVIYEHTDGFEIARQDLNIRGPGEFLGARQSGVPMLRFANLEEDLPLLEAARNIAPQLIDERPDIVEAHLARWLASRESYLGV